MKICELRNKYYSKKENIKLSENLKQNTLLQASESIKSCKLSILSKDVFERNISFGKENSDNSKDMSFESFKDWSDRTAFVTRVKDIADISGKILGSGFEGSTFEIPDSDKWVIKKYNRADIIPVSLSEPEIVKVEDISPELNIGQCIARINIPCGKNYSSVYYILKRQTGKSYGVPFSSSDEINEVNVNIHLKSLKSLSEMPQESFDKCISDIAYITERNYEIDCCNPYNFLIDEDRKSINFVDIIDRYNKESTQFGEVLFALLDGMFAINLEKNPSFTDEKIESALYSDKIISKYLKAMKKANVTFNEGKYFNKILSSKLLDRVLNAKSTDEKLQRLKGLGLFEA